MKCRLGAGAKCTQDFIVGLWPKLNEYHDYTDKVDTVFEKTDMGDGTFKLVAEGFGDTLGNNTYGNGAIYVWGMRKC